MHYFKESGDKHYKTLHRHPSGNFMAICPTVFAMLSVCTITLTEVKSFTDSVRDTLKLAPMFGYNVGFAFSVAL